MAPTKGRFQAVLFFSNSLSSSNSFGADITERRVQSYWIVESFDVIDHGPSRLLVGFVSAVVNLLDFEAFEEAFHGCVVVAIPFAAHAL